MDRRYDFSLQLPRPLDESDLGLLIRVASSGLFSQYASDVVARVETEFADVVGRRYAVMCNSGTSAVQIALIALDVPRGSEIVTTSLTDAGVIIPILYERMTPVFADIERESYNLSTQAVEEAIGPRTGAVIAVHLAGNPCDMVALQAVCDRAGVPLIEDFSQAHGSWLRGRRCGTFGSCAVASFQQSKQLTTGEGGVLVADASNIAQKARKAADKGWDRSKPIADRKYEFLAPSARVSALQAAVLQPQLRWLDAVSARRRNLADLLWERIEPSGWFARQEVLPDAVHSYYAFACRVLGGRRQRDWLVRTLDERYELGCVAGYTIPKPMYLSAPFIALESLEGQLPCVQTERLLEEMIVLPFHDSLSEGDIEEIAGRVAACAST